MHTPDWVAFTLALNAPTPHLVQTDLPARDVYVPATQLRQLAELVEPPAAEYVPTAQSAQTLVDEPVWYDPAAHRAQTEAVVIAAKDPARQLEHARPEALWYRPRPQLTQAEELLEPAEAEYVPDGQKVHAPADCAEQPPR